MSDAFSVRLEHDADIVWQLVLHMSNNQRSDYFGNDATQLTKDLSVGWIKCFLVERISDHKAVGFCIASLAYSTWIGRCLQLSVIFVQPEYRGRHLCTALVTAACRYACDVVKTTRVDCTLPESNTHVAKILESFGFFNLTAADRLESYRLAPAGLRMALKSELRPEIRLEGYGGVPTTPSAAYVVRPGTPNDANEVLSLIKDLVHFIGSKNEVKITADDLASDIESGRCGCVVAVDVNNLRVIGMSVGWCFLTIEYGLMTHLEDLFVAPQYRGLGIGKALIIAACHWARSQGATSMELRALDWNANAQGVYKAVGFENERNRRPVIDFRCDNERLRLFLSRSLPEGITMQRDW